MEYRLHEWVTPLMGSRSEGISGRMMEVTDAIVRELAGRELATGTEGGHTSEGCILSLPFLSVILSFLPNRK